MQAGHDLSGSRAALRVLRLTNNRRGLMRDFRNRNLAQRLTMVPDTVDLILLVGRDAAIELELPSNVTVRRPAVPGFFGLAIAALGILLTARRRGLDAVITDQSSLSGIGYLLRTIGGYCWIVDLVDAPHKQAVTTTGFDRQGRGAMRRSGSKVKVWVHRRVLRRADLVLSSVAPGALDRYEIPSDKIRFFGNALVLRAYPRSLLAGSRRPYSLCFVASRFFPDYGVDTLIAAIAGMPEGLRARVRCSLVGSVPDELSALIAASPVRTNFDLRGHLTVEEAHDLIAASEIGLAPYSWNDDVAFIHPVKVLEYMALGAVVVASNLPGVRSLVENEEQGVLIPPGDVTALSEALVNLLGNAKVRTRMREAARRRVEQFDGVAKGKEIYDAVDRAVADRRTQRGHVRPEPE